LFYKTKYDRKTAKKSSKKIQLLEKNTSTLKKITSTLEKLHLLWKIQY